MAIETRLRWLRFATDSNRAGIYDPKSQRGIHSPNIASDIRNYYQGVLEKGDTYYMDRHFSQLVDHARREVPGNLAFDNYWPLSHWGWLYIAEPFAVPKPYVKDPALAEKLRNVEARISAVGWLPIVFAEEGMIVGPQPEFERAEPDAYWFAFFQAFKDGSFHPWSYFHINNGDKLDDRIEEYESHVYGEGAYIQDESIDYNQLHEMRWTFAAMHLMSQRLAAKVREPTDRATRRRATHAQQKAPPFIEVITLRRKQLDQEREGARHDVDWQWQWAVRGHWRNQWFPGKGTHQPVFIESYIKGPPDKPVKPPAIKIFTAVR